MQGFQPSVPVPGVSGRLVTLAAELARDPASIVERATRALIEGDLAYAALAPSVKHPNR